MNVTKNYAVELNQFMYLNYCYVPTENLLISLKNTASLAKLRKTKANFSERRKREENFSKLRKNKENF